MITLHAPASKSVSHRMLIAAALAEGESGLELCALELHAALDSLGYVTGDRVDEKMMDEIFSRFCVGK